MKAISKEWINLLDKNYQMPEDLFVHWSTPIYTSTQIEEYGI